MGQEPVGAVEQQPRRRAQGRTRHSRRKDATVGRQGRGVAVHRLEECEVAERGQGRDSHEREAGTAPQPGQRHDAQRGRPREHLHVQPRQRRGEGGCGHRGGHARRECQQQAEGAAEGEAGRHLGVDVKGVERSWWPQRHEPGELRRTGVSAEAEGQRAGHEGEAGRHRGEEEHAGPPAAEGVHGREKDGQADSVSGKGTPVRARRAPVRLDVGRRVLLHLPPRHVVAQVEITVAPQALGHQEIVGLVAGDLQVRGVVHPHGREEDEARHEESESGSPEPDERPESVAASPQRGHGAGENGEHDTQGAVEHPKGGQRVDRPRHVSERETGPGCEEVAGPSHYRGLSSKWPTTVRPASSRAMSPLRVSPSQRPR
jgi:hypothetical protein